LRPKATLGSCSFLAITPQPGDWQVNLTSFFLVVPAASL
jgi:hypothetical protein